MTAKGDSCPSNKKVVLILGFGDIGDKGPWIRDIANRDGVEIVIHVHPDATGMMEE